MITKTDIRNLSREELIQYLTSVKEKSYRANQICEWIYQKNVTSFNEMRNLSRELRDRLSQDYSSKPLKAAKEFSSKDGTTKFLFELDDQQKIETVIIPAKNRTTACISTQAGCKFGCKFCASGIGGWIRDLMPEEILAQILHVKNESKKRERPLSHIVFMGVGEPLDTVALRW